MALYSMQELDMTKAGNSVHGLTLRKGTSQSKLVSIEGASFPEEFVTFVAKEDKSGLKQAIKNGQQFEGFNLEDGEPSLLIK